MGSSLPLGPCQRQSAFSSTCSELTRQTHRAFPFSWQTARPRPYRAGCRLSGLSGAVSILLLPPCDTGAPTGPAVTAHAGRLLPAELVIGIM